MMYRKFVPRVHRYTATTEKACYQSFRFEVYLLIAHFAYVILSNVLSDRFTSEHHITLLIAR